MNIKPGSVNQQPLYGCTGCYEDYTWPAWPAGDLRVYDNECWCGQCWAERRWLFPDQPYWDDLEPYTPAEQQPAADQFIATFRCENNGVVGTTNAKVHSVTRHDDGCIEVVIDHWPQRPAEQPEPDVAGLVGLLEHAQCSNCDGSGARYDNYGEPEQCQWCHERDAALAAHRKQGEKP